MKLMGLVFLIGTVIFWVASWITISIIDMMHSYHSRQREYVADRAGALLTSREHMIGALQALEYCRCGATERQLPPDPFGPLKIVNFSSRGLFGLFATHPSTEKRVQRLLEFDGPDS